MQTIPSYSIIALRLVLEVKDRPKSPAEKLIQAYVIHRYPLILIELVSSFIAFNNDTGS